MGLNAKQRNELQIKVLLIAPESFQLIALKLDQMSRISIIA